MRRCLLLAALLPSVGCASYCGEMVIDGLDLALVNPYEDERFEFDQTYGLQCYDRRGDWGRPAHVAHLFEDGLFVAPRPLIGVILWPSLREDGADWALTTAMTPMVYLEPDRIEEGAVLTPGDGIAHGEVDFFKELAPPRFFEDGGGGTGDTIDFTLVGTEGSVEVLNLVHNGADCDVDPEASLMRREANVRWKLGYDLTIGGGPGSPQGAEIRVTGTSWVLLEDGFMADANGLYEDLDWWCSRDSQP